MAYENIQADTNFYRQSFGQKGFRVITSSFTPVANEEYRVIIPLEDSTVSAVSLGAVGDNISSVAIPAGLAVYGLFSSVTVSAGRVLAYIA
jgi:hypothetical protein